MIGYFRFRIIDILRGTQMLKTLKFLRAVEFEEPSEINKLTQKRLDQYIRDLRNSSNIYQTLVFKDLPIIDKGFANKNRSQLENKDYKGGLFRKKTGGSTGEPFVYFTGEESQSYLWAAILLSWKIAGYKIGDPVVFLAGSSIFGTGWKQKVFYKLMNVRLLSAFDMTEDRIDQYVAEIKNTKSVIIYGYAGAIHRVAQHILSLKPTPDFYLRGIVCTAEVLTDAMRADIERAFGVPCYSQYGCNDAGVSAYECERREGYHLITTRCYAEVMSDGRLVSTDMTNTAFFLPRYDTGDIVEMSDVPCQCGRGFPLIKKVIGRSNDLVVDRNNKTVHSSFFSFLFREDPRIKSFQVTFDDKSLTVNIHTDMIESDWENYIEKIELSLEFNTVNIVVNQDFLVSHNGKVRTVMRIDKDR